MTCAGTLGFMTQPGFARAEKNLGERKPELSISLFPGSVATPAEVKSPGRDSVPQEQGRILSGMKSPSPLSHKMLVNVGSWMLNGFARVEMMIPVALLGLGERMTALPQRNEPLSPSSLELQLPQPLSPSLKPGTADKEGNDPKEQSQALEDGFVSQTHKENNIPQEKRVSMTSRSRLTKGDPAGKGEPGNFIPSPFGCLEFPEETMDVFLSPGLPTKEILERGLG